MVDSGTGRNDRAETGQLRGEPRPLAKPRDCEVRQPRPLLGLVHAEPLQTLTKFSSLPPLWAVSRGREFIGTLPVVKEETTKEFEAGCARWIEELLGRTSG